MWKLWPISHQKTVMQFSIFYHAGYFSSQMKKPPLLSPLSAEQQKNTVIFWYDFFHKILEPTMVKTPVLNVVSPLWKSVSITSLISNEKFCSMQYLLKNNTQKSTSWGITQTLSHSPNSCTLLHTFILLCKVSNIHISATIILFNFLQQISARKHLISSTQVHQLECISSWMN
jgi:hypothetical protein